MGGYGSGWRGTKKVTVEKSLSLSMTDLVRKGAAVPGLWTRGSWVWRQGCVESRVIASIGYEANLVDAEAAWLRLHYSASGEEMDYRIRLTTTRPHYGGLRWWFLCSLACSNGEEGRRVGKLYLPPGAHHFGSRRAHGLTYRSCQESGQFSGLFRALAAEMGTDETTVRRALKEVA